MAEELKKFRKVVPGSGEIMRLFKMLQILGMIKESDWCNIRILSPFVYKYGSRQ